MRVARAELRDFRNYERAEISLGPSLTVVSGPNGAGKTNLLEAVYFGCTARSPRTTNERELIRRGAGVTRVTLDTSGEDGGHRVEVGFTPGEAKRIRVDGRSVESLANAEERPLAAVFLPERLELVKGAPASRRAHLDRFVAALWPARAETRTGYSRALAQRNALLARIKGGHAGPAGLEAWDAELARLGVALMADRSEAVEGLRPPFAAHASALGLPGDAEIRYRPRSDASTADELVAELVERREADLSRGFTAHGPHRDELQLLLEGVPLRSYGSQGQQRSALLALLFAERDLLLELRDREPLMLLDDVMSELDRSRRELLAGLLRERGQALVTTTDPEHVPGSRDADELVEVAAGTLVGEPA
ncbi:MAG TPA: DNA replication/repair protein RecF [Thermoleophilaceae bacterium]|jgi:DNA replication and repair protein RecF